MDFLDKVIPKVVGHLDQQTAATKYIDDPVLWAQERLGITLWSMQQDIAYSVRDNKSTAVKACHGSGKATTLGTELFTPKGWVTMGDIQVGDQVFDEMGIPTTVVRKSAVWEEDVYKVTFDDGTFIEVHPNHEWNVLDLTTRRRGVSDWREHWDDTVTLTTQEIVDKGLKTSSNQNRWRIPTATPLQTTEAELPIDPYLLGYWLGDGSATSGSISIGLKKTGLFDWLTAHDYAFNPVFVPEKNAYVFTVFGLKDKLWELDLLGNKHIPVEYLVASEEQRRQLLAGLMDADGFHITGASVGMDTTDKQMSDDLYTLLVSLGYKVSHNEGVAAYTKNDERTVTGTRYRFSWVTETDVFLTRDTGWHVSTTQASRHTQRTIVAIEKVESAPTQCIEVDSPRHLFLAGRGMIPTHNSFLAAVLIAWWIDVHPIGEAFFFTTAPSAAQISVVLGRELRGLLALSHKRVKDKIIDRPLPGHFVSPNEWKLDDGTTLGIGRKPPDHTTDDATQGIHGKYILAVGDEANGLTKSMIDALGNITTGEHCRRLIIGNPTNPASEFGHIYKEDRQNWKKFTISAFDTPNFTDEKDLMPQVALDSLTGPSYVEEKRIEWGENDPRWKSRVLGEFAYDLGDTFIPSTLLAKAMDTEIVSDVRPILGVDIGRHGTDSSVVYANYGGRIRFVDSWGNANSVESANRVDKLARELNASEVRVDGIGVGAGVVDQLVHLCEYDYLLIEMISSHKSPDPKQWHNARAFWWSNVKDKMFAGQLDIDPDDDDLTGELAVPQYKYAPQGGLLIESKDEMRKRGVGSPDYADAAIFAATDLWIHEEEEPFKPGTLVSQSIPEDEYGWDTVLAW